MAQLMRTSNPALSGDVFRTAAGVIGEPMTVAGTVNKAGLLMLCCVATAAWSWNRFFNAPSPEAAMQSLMPLIVVGGIGGFILALVTIFKKEWAGVTAPLIYALLEGLVLALGLGDAGDAFSRHRHPGRGAYVWHAHCYVAGLPLRLDPSDGQVADRHCRRNWRHRAILSGAIFAGFLWCPLQRDQWLGPAGNRLQPHRGGGGCSEPRA